MMWIPHRTKHGDTLKSITKLYKNKDPNAVLKYHMNKKVTKRLKNGDHLNDGEIVWVLNPSSKIFFVSNGKKKLMLDQKGYDDTVKEANKVMDRVLDIQRINFEAAWNRHDAQNRINEDQAMVFAFMERFSKAKDPMREYGKASASYKALTRVVKSRDYKLFKSVAITCEVDVANYNNAVINWVNGLTKTTGKTIKVANGIRMAGEFCTFALITTACPPAALGAKAALGAAAAGVSTGLIFDGWNMIGRAAAGTEQMSYKEVGKKMVINALTAGAGSLIVARVAKIAGPQLASCIANPKFASNWSRGAAGKLFTQKMITAEARLAAKALEKRGGQALVDAYLKEFAASALIKNAAARFITRISAGSMLKFINSRIDYDKLLFGWIKSLPEVLSTNDDDKIGRLATEYMMKQGVGETVLNSFAKENHNSLREDLRATIVEGALEHAKQAA